jgi:hypothetical protein
MTMGNMTEVKIHQLAFWEPPTSAVWIDFTRRNDPAAPFWVRRLQEQLDTQRQPDVLCFWTKAPAVVAALYGSTIRALQQAGTLVLAQVTDNHYERVLEPGILPERANLQPLVELLGAQAIRLRFDPIIPSFTTVDHFQACLEDALRYGIRRITINWIVIKRYRNVAARLQRAGIEPVETTEAEQAAFARDLLAQASGRVELAVCAENHNLVKQAPELKTAACADMAWAAAIRPDLAGRFKRHPSRTGCGCCYSADWGVYSSQRVPKCVHGCVYCYAGSGALTPAPLPPGEG